MRWLVNGAEHEFNPSSLELRLDGDLVWIRTIEGWKSAAVLRRGNQIQVSYRGRQYVLEPVRSGPAAGAAASSGEVRAPMPGLLVSVGVKVGDSVRRGDILMVLEAMKTQIPLASPRDGIVESLIAEPLQQVKSNQILAIVNEVAKH